MSNGIKIKIKYFAALREKAGLSSEEVETAAKSPRELYKELVSRFEFSLSENQIRVAINDEYKCLDTPLSGGDSVTFIPPVAGG